MLPAATFRADYPEFADTTIYTNSAIMYWSNLANLLLNADRWADMLTIGTELYIAHNLVLEKQAQDTAAIGGTPGVSQGPQSSKSVGGVSISYDTQAGIEADAGHWNLTTYGTRFIKLCRMAGAGPVHIGGWC